MRKDTVVSSGYILIYIFTFFHWGPLIQGIPWLGPVMLRGLAPPLTRLGTFFSSCCTPRKESLLKSIMSQKLRVGQKKTHEIKHHCQINPHLSCKFGYFWIISICSRMFTSLATITQKLNIGNFFPVFYSFHNVSQLFGLKNQNDTFWGGKGGLHIIN